MSGRGFSRSTRRETDMSGRGEARRDAGRRERRKRFLKFLIAALALIVRVALRLYRKRRYEEGF